ncbi:zinc metalloendopeptidase M23 domain protein [Geotalea daltonii FRC-32]|uniref:Zinc metalloendopeptidase M23 domain protein n=1 Tax=Geotalea daltonii (strain DSM 22248 / JCM 15807 / FRC-32) TaxID=316067 RepID=B9M1C1_GEODF|nr:zinc metalloendopeptidase M23 domain protein [Geotalea daltonii FRC-32]
MHLLTLTILVLIYLLLPFQCLADVKDDLQGINREINQKKSLLNKTKKVETKVSGELQQIEKNLQEKETNLLSLGRDLRGVENNLGRIKGQIESVEAEAFRKKQQINSRISALYKAGDAGNIRIFFSSGSFSQMMENLRYMKAVLENDRKLFTDYQAKMEQLRLLKTELEHDQANKERIRSKMEAKRLEIAEEKKIKTGLLLKVREDKQGYIVSLKKLQANAKRLQSMVERLEARSRKGYTVRKNKAVTGAERYVSIPDKGLGAQKGKLSLPVKGSVTAQFGRHKHPQFNSYTVNNGISINAPVGTQIHAIYDGQVIFADYFKGYGNMIIVDHGGGFFSLYAHASSINKRVGATVAKNDVVASVGDSDSSNGSMLYFEIRYQGKPVDPSPWFR